MQTMEILKEYTDYTIFFILAIMAFLAIYCTLERILFFRKLDLREFKNQDSFDKAITENLTTLHIIYSNAPYVGLLGTVVGIMITFYDMSLSGNIDVKSIVLGLSLALKATALGLLVAIPTLIAYNALFRKINILSTDYKEAQND